MSNHTNDTNSASDETSGAEEEVHSLSAETLMSGGIPIDSGTELRHEPIIVDPWNTSAVEGAMEYVVPSAPSLGNGFRSVGSALGHTGHGGAS